MATTILVTGATGTIGTHTVKALAAKSDVQIRIGVRNPAKAAGLSKPNVAPVEFDFATPSTFSGALMGVHKVFLLTPFQPDAVELGNRLIDAAKAAGVQQVVKLSAMGADSEPGIQLGRWHRETEKHLEASGLAWTMLRPNSFMDNFLTSGPGPDGNIYQPIGEGAISYIDGADIGACAATVLTSPGHEGKYYELTGPEALQLSKVADAIAAATGRTIKYVDVPPEAAGAAMGKAGVPAFAVAALLELFAIGKAGYAGAVTENVKKLTGRAPRSFAEFAREHAARWRS